VPVHPHRVSRAPLVRTVSCDAPCRARQLNCCGFVRERTGSGVARSRSSRGRSLIPLPGLGAASFGPGAVRYGSSRPVRIGPLIKHAVDCLVYQLAKQVVKSSIQSTSWPTNQTTSLTIVGRNKKTAVRVGAVSKNKRNQPLSPFVFALVLALCSAWAPRGFHRRLSVSRMPVIFASCEAAHQGLNIVILA